MLGRRRLGGLVSFIASNFIIFTGHCNSHDLWLLAILQPLLILGHFVAIRIELSYTAKAWLTYELGMGIGLVDLSREEYDIDLGSEIIAAS